MNLLKKIKDFFDYVFLYFNKDATFEENIKLSNNDTKVLENALVDIENSNFDEKIVVSKKTILAKLYSLEQTITVLEIDYPQEFNSYMKKIEDIRKCYADSIEESEKPLTFEIDPDIDYKKIMEVIKLENEIQNFIDKKMKFDIISKRLQCLIKKINILYNTSIYYENEKSKVINQIQHALETEKEIVKDFKECDEIIENIKLKERIISLISYADYLIFKTNIRNSNMDIKELTKNILVNSQFESSNYISDFKDYILDEISDLGELLPLIKDNEFGLILKTKIGTLLKKITYSENIENYIYDKELWEEFLKLEKTIIDILINNGVSKKDKANVRLLIRMDINVSDDEIFISPRANTILYLSSVCSGFSDTKSYLMTKLLSVLSNDITYKEIYFLLIIFDTLDEVVNKKNELLKHIEKYINKYSYSKKSIDKKKEDVINLENKDYIFTFNINIKEKGIIEYYLKKSKLDYIIKNNEVYLNSFYFKDLENVMMSLENNLKKN